MLVGLSALGVRLSIDDSGTVFSSLGDLRRLPVREIKLGTALTAGLARGRGDATVLRSLIDLGLSLGLDVLAERVDEGEAFERLLGLDSTHAQGEYFGPAMSVTRSAPGSRYDASRQPSPRSA